jgi:DNA-binding GntR family transcriptional regulator
MSRASDQAYDFIRKAILGGQLAPGVQLKEEELAQMCGVSRTPVREAMRRLDTEMFIQRTDSQRSFVSKWSLDDINELFTLRHMLESHAAGRAAELVTKEVLLKLHANNEAISSAIDRPIPDIDAFLRNNAEFHGLIIEAAASDRLATMIKRLVLQPIVHRTALRYGREQLERSLAEHVEIVAALDRRDKDWASSVMTSHIRRAFHVYVEDQNVPIP